MTVLLLGAGGQLAHALERELADWDLVGLSHAQLDICDTQALARALDRIRPSLVINTAAFHNVDLCELNWRQAFQVNALAVHHLARLCQERGCALAYISTDYVFAGEKESPYVESDVPSPLNIYGMTKQIGEIFVRSLCTRHYIIRTSGLFGLRSSVSKGGNFVERMLGLALSRRTIHVVDDQVFAPTYCSDLASRIRELFRKEKYGLYHIANTGQCSWFELAERTFELAGIDVDLRPITSQEYGGRAQRPPYSVLVSEELPKIGLSALRHWEEALADYFVKKGSFRGVSRGHHA